MVEMRKKKAKVHKKEKKMGALDAIFSGASPVSGPFTDPTLKEIRQHLFKGPIEERTEYHVPEFNAIVYLSILADHYKSAMARAILDSISKCRISLDRKGRAELVETMRSEIQRQYDQQRLEIERLKTTMGDRR